ncbi:hypothetical protein Amme_009_023 [Acidomonas methanolica NBRC 104435]|uniref:Uncharacterized protein n=1 Tax=Acidomonas methanolica NBRC 104435 TaxID=1231351 RepID=A0A023D236_ACIMT|nr:hypothetical protein Amme_009_023 [Acidomonas methanolica NBRC 104435]
MPGRETDNGLKVTCKMGLIEVAQFCRYRGYGAFALCQTFGGFLEPKSPYHPFGWDAQIVAEKPL